MTGLTINPERVAKVVPDRIFSVALHPGPDKLVAACGGKWGAVGLWECEDTESPSHGVHLLNYHSRPVNCLTWDSAASHQLISTSYDGTTRQLDVTKQEASLLYHDPDFLEAGGWASFHCQPEANSFLVSLGNQGAVARVDRRVGPRPVATLGLFDRLHAKSISSHPTQPHLLLAANNKGGCFIFDLRVSPKGRGLLDPVTELLGAERSLSSCQFSPTGGQVVTLSSDDKLRLYKTAEPGASTLPCAQVKHNNHTGRWLTPFRASWHPARENLLAMGSMERPRRIELWSTEGGRLTMAGQLQGEELGSVASIVALHPSRDAIVGGNSSGRLHLFM
jgi:WD40 repeat protein